MTASVLVCRTTWCQHFLLPATYLGEQEFECQVLISIVLALWPDSCLLLSCAVRTPFPTLPQVV